VIAAIAVAAVVLGAAARFGQLDSLPVPLVAAEGTSICTACVTAASPARAGGEAEVSVDPALFHYFDPDTGVAVGTATTAPATA